MDEVELPAIGKQLQVPPDRLPRHIEEFGEFGDTDRSICREAAQDLSVAAGG